MHGFLSVARCQYIRYIEKYVDCGLSMVTVNGGPLKPVRTPVAIFGSLGVCIYVPASRHWLISYSPVHLN